MGDGKFTKENAREMQARGVEKRKQNTAERKAFKDYFDELLNESGGTYNGEPATRKKILAVKMINYLTNDGADLDEGKAFTQIFKEIRDTIGEKPIDKVAVANIDQSLEALDDAFARETGVADTETED